MEPIDFEITGKPLERARLEQIYASLVERKAEVKRKAIRMMGVGASIYIACFVSWMLHNEGMLSALYPMATLGAALGWMLGTNLHHVYTSQTRNRAVFITGLVVLVLGLFALSRFGKEVALVTVLSYLLVLLLRYLFDNRVIDVISLNQQVRDYTFLELADGEIEAELSRMRGISVPIDGYLKAVQLLDRPLVAGEFLMLRAYYGVQQGGTPLSSTLSELSSGAERK